MWQRFKYVYISCFSFVNMMRVMYILLHICVTAVCSLITPGSGVIDILKETKYVETARRSCFISRAVIALVKWITFIQAPLMHHSRLQAPIGRRKYDERQRYTCNAWGQAKFVMKPNCFLKRSMSISRLSNITWSFNWINHILNRFVSVHFCCH